MKIDAFTSTPQDLIKAIEKKIKEGDIKTWEIVYNDKDEVLYSHTPEQWSGKALPKPFLFKDRVRFRIRWWSKNVEPSHAVKGYITGRFTEILLVHFSEFFEKLEIYKK